MKYINESVMSGLDAAAFQQQRPYPWLNPEGFLTADGFSRLADSLPEPELFDKRFGEKRKHGQAPHDRLALEFRPDLPLAQPWREFVDELRGPAYRGFLERMFGRGALRLILHGTTRRTAARFRPTATRAASSAAYLLLQHRQELAAGLGRRDAHPRRQRPLSRRFGAKFEDFDRVMPAKAIGNSSLLFMRRERSWHGVKEIRCPPDHLRKVFIVVIEDWDLKARVKSLLRGNKNRY